MIQFPLAYVLSKHSALAARGLWWSFPVANLVVAFIAICWFAKGDWKKTRLTAEKQETPKKLEETLIEEPLR